MNLITERVQSLKPWAETLMMLGYPFQDIFLVGSGAYSAKPRDIDISAVMKDDEFAIHFMNPNKWIEEGRTGRWTKKRWKWSGVCTALWKQGCRATGRNIDFKIVPMTYHLSQGGISISLL